MLENFQTFWSENEFISYNAWTFPDKYWEFQRCSPTFIFGLIQHWISFILVFAVFSAVVTQSLGPPTGGICGEYK